MKRKKERLRERLARLGRRCIKALMGALLLLLAVRANTSFFRGAFDRALENGAAFLICAPIYARFDRAGDALSRLWKRGGAAKASRTGFAKNAAIYE